jgi:hypothetical protein
MIRQMVLQRHHIFSIILHTHTHTHTHNHIHIPFARNKKYTYKYIGGVESMMTAIGDT